jgi:hypothetical protein
LFARKPKIEASKKENNHVPNDEEKDGVAKSAELARAIDAVTKEYGPDEIGTALCACLVILARRNRMPPSTLITIVLDSIIKGWDAFVALEENGP